jgi:hypothetical protein
MRNFAETEDLSPVVRDAIRTKGSQRINLLI